MHDMTHLPAAVRLEMLVGTLSGVLHPPIRLIRGTAAARQRISGELEDLREILAGYRERLHSRRRGTQGDLHMKLDAETVAALKLDGKTDAIWFDDQLPGFGYRCRASGGGQVRRSWVVQYRRAGGTRRLLLGSADVLSAAQARTAAQQVLAKVALGADPQAAKVDRRAADKHSVRSVVEEFLAVKQAEVRPHTFSGLKLYLTGPYFRPLHGMAIDVVSRRDVASALAAITRKSGAPTAGLARGALSGFYAWAMTQGFAENNPVMGTAAPKLSRARERCAELRRIELDLARLRCQRLRNYRQAFDPDRPTSR